MGDCVLSGIRISYCRVPVIFENIKFEQTTGGTTELFNAECSEYVAIKGCEISGISGTNKYGISISSGTTLYSNMSKIHNCGSAIIASNGCIAVMRGASGEHFYDNKQGVYCWVGGIVIVAEENSTLGGSYNTVGGGGAIFDAAGRLISGGQK